jgi:GAF domain-containing protein
LFGLLQAVCQCSDLDRILACALDALIDEFGMKNCGIDIRDIDSDRFTIRASRNLTDAQLQAIRHFRERPGADFPQQVLNSGQVVFVRDLTTNELFQDTLEF